MMDADIITPSITSAATSVEATLFSDFGSSPSARALEGGATVVMVDLVTEVAPAVVPTDFPLPAKP